MSSWPSVVLLQPGPGTPHPTKTTQEEQHFQMAGPGTVFIVPGAPQYIPDTEPQTLSVGLTENILNWSDDSVQCICWCAEWVRVTAAWLTQWPKIITLLHVRPSPQAVLFCSKPAAHY